MSQAKNQADKELAKAFTILETIEPRWSIEFGQPHSEGWISGENFYDAADGNFNELLERIRTRMNTKSRKIAAASFALRFGWSSGIIFGPYVINESIADARLSNISLKFNQSTLFEKAAMHQLQAFENLNNSESSIEQIKKVLILQAEPIVDALHSWSRFSKKAIWGQITSSWGGQCAQILQVLERSEETIPLVEQIFKDLPIPNKTAPTFYEVSYKEYNRCFHKRSSCCLYFKINPKHFCMSCPIISEEERLKRNKGFLCRNIES